MASGHIPESATDGAPKSGNVKALENKGSAPALTNSVEPEGSDGDDSDDVDGYAAATTDIDTDDTGRSYY